MGQGREGGVAAYTPTCNHGHMHSDTVRGLHIMMLPDSKKPTWVAAIATEAMCLRSFSKHISICALPYYNMRVNRLPEEVHAESDSMTCQIVKVENNICCVESHMSLMTAGCTT